MKDFGAECRDVRFREVGVTHSPTLFLVTMTVLHDVRADTRDPP